MNGLIQNLRDLGRTRLMILGGVGLALVVMLLWGLNQVNKPVYSGLYNGLSPSEASEIVSVLEQGGISVEVSPDSSVVSIPKSDFARARMMLAENGLPSSGAPGWEIFDNAGGLGMNTYMQRINRLRALEGELSRSIQTIDGIEAARVHLVLPEREAFSREKPEPSASVIIRTSMSFAMNKKQGLAIRHLVSSAVPELAVNKVAVLTSDGEVLVSEDGSSGVGDASLQSVKAAQEDALARSVESMLAARVGAGNVRVKVSLDLSNERKVVQTESFNPEEQVVRSTETANENEENIDGSSQNVSVDNNLPENLQAPEMGGGSDRSTRQKNREVINYEIGSTRTETVYEPGDLRSISVAVLVNGIYERADGDVEYVDRSPEEVARLEELVKSAIGFDEARGDKVTVDSLRFMDYSMEVGDPIEHGIMDILQDNLMTILKWVFILAIVALVVFGLRPLLQRLVVVEKSEENDDQPEVANGQAPASANAQPVGAAQSETGGSAAAGAGDVDDDDDEMIDMASVQGGIRKKRLMKLAETVSNNETEAASVIRSWLTESNEV